jgi:Carboxypeptidase regulatory-like domain
VIELLMAALIAHGRAQTPARDTRPPAALAAGTISGIVVSDAPEPRPLRRARVTLNGQGLDMPRTVITADDGSFAFDRVAPGRLTLGAAKDGYVAMNYGSQRTGRPGTGIEIAERQSVRLTLRLPRGAVLTGTVTGVDGVPVQGIAVAALTRRYMGQQGEARYVYAGTTPASVLTDDRGIYRIYGLPAGEYLVAAQSQARQAGLATEVRTLTRGVVSDRSLVMAQVFHPGVTDVARASRVTVRAGEERSGIDLVLQYVPLAGVSGVVTMPMGGQPPQVTLQRSGEGVAGAEPGRIARADADGRFTFAGIPPGQYTMFARTNGSSGWLFATADVTVDGEDLTNVALSMLPALTIAGRLAFESATGRVPFGGATAMSDAGITLAFPLFPPATAPGTVQPEIRLESGGRFSVVNLAPGTYRSFSGAGLQGIRAPIGAWWLKSFAINGRDLLDGPFDIRESTTDAVATFTDAASEIAGRVTDAAGLPAREPFVVVFSADRTFWFAGSRRIAGVRPDADGRYSIRNLPPGDYHLSAAGDIDQGEWFDPAVLERLRPAAGSITLSGVDRKTQDVVIRDRP